MRILEIVKKIVIVVFIMVMTLVGWTFFEGVFYYNEPNRNYLTTITTVRQIHSGELEAKSEYGKYLGLRELVEKELAPQHLIDGEHSGYKFKVDLTEDDFVIKATAKNKGESLVSITMKSNSKIFVTRNHPDNYLINKNSNGR